MQAQLNMNYVNTTSELASIELQKKTLIERGKKKLARYRSTSFIKRSA